MSRSAARVPAPPRETGSEPAPHYERRLDRDPEWALSEGSRHFEEKSAVFEALRKITRRLDDLGIPYAVVGGMALFRHGLRRFTEDVDLLVTREDLRRIHEGLQGLGYLPAHRHSKHLRDTQLGVRIEFVITGDYPGDGKPKPVRFPQPETAAFEAEGTRYVNLETLIDLKLASGMTNPGRIRDLSDVMELTRILGLPRDFGERLNPYVRGKYEDLWQQGRKRYVTLCHVSRDAAQLDRMQREGGTLESDDVPPGYIRIVSTDPQFAARHGLVEESEFWADEEQSE